MNTMTRQISDYFYYKGQKFTLIDVEKGKQIIDYGRFRIPKYDGGYVSSCWRGYKAVYSVEKKQLWGIKQNFAYGYDEEKSEKVPIYFTGSCIIAFGDDIFSNSDFLESYLWFDKAYELHFTRGILTWENDISKAILEAKSLYDYDEEEYFKAQYQLARKYLKYKYDDNRTYKWRTKREMNLKNF